MLLSYLPTSLVKLISKYDTFQEDALAIYIFFFASTLAKLSYDMFQLDAICFSVLYVYMSTALSVSEAYSVGIFLLMIYGT